MSPSGKPADSVARFGWATSERPGVNGSAEPLRVVVVHATMRKGSTYHVAQQVLETLADSQPMEIQRIRLLREAPDFCTGCYLCFDEGGHRCPHADKVAPLERKLRAADLIIICCPVYAGGVPAQLKSVFDHLSYSELMHKPHPAMFDKVAVSIVLSAGKGHRQTAGHIRRCLADLGISHTFSIAELVAANSWDTVTEHRRRQLSRKVQRLVPRIERALRGPRVSLRTRFFFNLSRLSIKKWGWNQSDILYWWERGWLGGARPWKQLVGAAPSTSASDPSEQQDADDRSAVPNLTRGN